MFPDPGDSPRGRGEAGNFFSTIPGPGISENGAPLHLWMTADMKDAKTFFSVKKCELDQNDTLELSFVESIFMIYKLRKKIAKAKAEHFIQ